MGKDALAKVPGQIQLSRVASPQWKDAATIQQQAAPLVRAGFNGPGTYSVDKIPGVLVRILFQQQTYVAAHITEHPKAGNWIEFATRYNERFPDHAAGPGDHSSAVRAHGSRRQEHAE
jgi:hypothetical protein